MARYPGARWDPLGAQTEPRMQAHDIACLHTMVGTLAGTSSMFHQNGYGGTESHWGMGHDGATLQWQDISHEADANYNGNHRVLSMETADRGTGFSAWSNSDVPAWTPKQVDKLVGWLLWVTSKEAHRDCPADWLCHHNGIPRVLVSDTKPGRRGIGYHRQGVDSYPALYAAGWRQPGGELWSGSRGKVCPGDRRIHQLKTVIIPRVQLATANPLEDDMTPDETEAAVNAALVKAITIPGHPFRAELAVVIDSRLARSGLATKADLAADDVDEAAVVAGVLEGLDPTVIAAAIPETIAEDVADLLAARLAG